MEIGFQMSASGVAYSLQKNVLFPVMGISRSPFELILSINIGLAKQEH